MNGFRIIAATFLGISILAAGRAAEDLPLLVQEDFESGAQRWQTTDVKRESWKIIETENGHAFRVTGKSDYQPPHRSPHSIALLKDIVVTDFVLTARLQNTNPKAGGHRDLCLFFGYQDPANFYYVHLATKADPHAGQIFIVDDAPRTKITREGAPGTAWDDDWHQVKIVRRVADGTIDVYFDDMSKPHLRANDRTFLWGQVGIGTFDDNGNWDDIQLRGIQIDRPDKE